MAKKYSDIFEKMKISLLRAPQNIHRIQHASDNKLKEETVTDLLLHEMSGRDLQVSFSCPGCDDSPCILWSTDSGLENRQIESYALTRYEEGGNEKHGAKGIYADWALQLINSEGHVIRILVQAKNGFPGPRDEEQAKSLAGRSHDLAAVAYHAIYVKKDHPHCTTPTACPNHTAPPDTAVILISTGEVIRILSREEKIDEHTIEQSGRPMVCLGGCDCLGTRRKPLFESILEFIRIDYPEWIPAHSHEIEQNISLPSVTADATKQVYERSQKGGRKAKLAGDEIFIVRVGKPSLSDVDRDYQDDSSPRRVGWHVDPPLSDEEWREATRKYWRASLERARNVEFLVASYRGKVQRIYRVKPNGGVIKRHDRDGRIEFDVMEVENDSRLYEKIKKIAEDRLVHIENQSPFIYADFED